MPPRSHRGGGHGRSQPGLILPFALTLTTAAIASAGLYFFSGNSAHASYPGSDSEHEPDGRRRASSSSKPPISANRRRREYLNCRRKIERELEHDISEEDTDAIEESRKEEELRLSKRRATGISGAAAAAGVYGAATAAGHYMKDAATHAIERFHETRHDDSDDKYEEIVVGKRGADFTARSESALNIGVSKVNTASAKDSQNLPISFTSGTEKKEQYVPMQRPKKTIVTVVSERKATQGHDSDNEFEEALVPSRSLLTQLPRPVKLTSINLYILIHSPHLTTHPLSKKETDTITLGASAGLPTPDVNTTLTIQSPSPMPSPSLQAQRYHEDLSKSTYDLALSLLPRDSPRENIMPFQETSSIVALLRQLSPTVVYFEEAVLEGEEATVEALLQGGWVGVVVVVVGGDGDELAGLVSEDDAATEKRKGAGKWWSEGSELRRRFGKRIEIVEGWVLEEDWRRRVEEENV